MGALLVIVDKLLFELLKAFVVNGAFWLLTHCPTFVSFGKRLAKKSKR